MKEVFPNDYKNTIENEGFKTIVKDIIVSESKSTSDDNLVDLIDRLQSIKNEISFSLDNIISDLSDRENDYNDYITSQIEDNFGSDNYRENETLSITEENQAIDNMFSSLIQKE